MTPEIRKETDMENIRLLDCTLRDGGYINDWNFGEKTIRSIIDRLIEAKTDLVEVGFLRNCTYDPDRTLFHSVRELKKVLPSSHGNTKFVAMALHNQYDIRNLEECDGTVDAVRVTFHDYDVEEGLDFCRKVKEKGYQLFINPINIMGYRDQELVKLLKKVSNLEPYGFSIVDTFGSMTKKELVRIYSLCENNLDEAIVLGLHLHENMAQSFLLAQTFLEMKDPRRNCVLDASLNGMGRVPGNLCLELIMDYMNRSYGKDYDIDPVLDAIEEYITPIKSREPWGYMAEYFISAKYNLHRNYAEYLLSKGTLTARDMHQILKMLPENKKSAFDPACIEELYQEYKNQTVSDQASLGSLKQIFEGRAVVLLAPGTSLEYQWDKVKDYIRSQKAIIVSANFYFAEQEGGFAFFSNAKRFAEYQALRKQDIHVILTSNITKGVRPGDDVINYRRLAMEGEEPSENCGIMILRLMSLLKVKEAALAGFDGYTSEGEDYMKGYFGAFQNAREGDNRKITGEIRKLQKKIKILFLTPSQYEEAV